MSRRAGPADAVPAPLFHLALAGEWAAAQAVGTYDRSTVGRSLAEEGFIHCSFREQAQGTADRFYRGRRDVVLLRIDPAAIQAPVRVEAVAGGDRFPHVYGPVPVPAVLSVHPVPVDDDGRLDVAAALRSA